MELKLNAAMTRALAVGAFVMLYAWTPVREAFTSSGDATSGAREPAPRQPRSEHRTVAPAPSLPELVPEDLTLDDLLRAPTGPPVPDYARARNPEAARRQIAAAITATKPLQDRVRAYDREHRHLPPAGEIPSLAAAGLQATVGVGGMIEIEFTGGALAGESFSLIPEKREGIFRWMCAQGRLAPEYFDGACPEQAWRRRP